MYIRDVGQKLYSIADANKISKGKDKTTKLAHGSHTLQ